jgi:hypothetical protein
MKINNFIIHFILNFTFVSSFPPVSEERFRHSSVAKLIGRFERWGKKRVPSTSTPHSNTSPYQSSSRQYQNVEAAAASTSLTLSPPIKSPIVVAVLENTHTTPTNYKHEPIFPPELEREIFETAFREHREAAVSLLLVARRVRIW